MTKVINFFKDSYHEMLHKVTWTKYGELQNSSFLVLIASLIFALVIGLIDFAFESVMQWVYNAF